MSKAIAPLLLALGFGGVLAGVTLPVQLATAATVAATSSPDRPLTGRAWSLADQAYKAYDAKDFDLAQSLAAQAIAVAPDAPQLYLLRIYALQAQGQNAEAVLVAKAARDRGLQRPVFDSLLSQPTTQAPDKASPATDTLQGIVQTAYSAYEAQRYAEAITAARRAVELAPGVPQYEALLTTALAAGSPTENLEALSRLNKQLSVAPDDAGLLMQRGYLYVRLGNPARAVDDFSAARSTGKAPARAALDAGFASAAAGNKRQAAVLLKEGVDAADEARIELTPAERLNLRQNIANLEREWGAYVSAGYRGARAATSGLGGSPVAALGDATFSTAEVFWRPSGVLNSTSRVFEVYGRMSNTLHDKGTTVGESVDACGNRSAPDSYRSVSGLPSTVGTLGLRFTPSTDLGLTFGLERRFNLGSRSRVGSATPLDCNAGIPGKEYQTKGHDGDWMAYVTYAFYKGTELRQDVSNWWRIEGYVQGGYLWRDFNARFRDSGAAAFDQSGRVKRDYRFAQGELRVGRSYRLDAISSKFVVYPYVVIAADWQIENTRASINGVGRFALQGNGRSWSLGAGPGISGRHWFRADHYGAERSYLDWSVQYRFNIGGGARDRSRGLFATLTMSW